MTKDINLSAEGKNLINTAGARYFGERYRTYEYGKFGYTIFGGVRCRWRNVACSPRAGPPPQRSNWRRCGRPRQRRCRRCRLGSMRRDSRSGACRCEREAFGVRHQHLAIHLCDQGGVVGAVGFASKHHRPMSSSAARRRHVRGGAVQFDPDLVDPAVLQHDETGQRLVARAGPQAHAVHLVGADWVAIDRH